EVSAEGYETEKRWVSLSAGEDETISMRLTVVRVAQPAATRPSAGGKTRNSLGMEFVYVSPGSFMMGSPSGESGRDSDEKQRRVTLTHGYYMRNRDGTVMRSSAG
ncbi:MAG: hypothetical protein JRD04_08890, partial [Deltaproteobacteria bacterium]|nr:hypothetical protein [Deltaproteobacteria bacterium]